MPAQPPPATGIAGQGSHAPRPARRAHMHTASLMLVLLVASCATVETSVVDSNLSLDFSRFRTYAWGPRGGAPSGAEVDRQIEDAIDAQLLAHGLVRVHAPADLEVRFYASADRETDEIGRAHV